MFDLSGCTCFSQYLINGKFWENFFEHKCGVFYFLSNNSHSKNNSSIYYPKCTWVFLSSTRYSCQILMKLQFSRRVSKNIQIASLIKIRPVGPELFLVDGHTYIHTYIHTDMQKNGQAAITNVVIGYPEIIGLLKFSLSLCKGWKHATLLLEFYFSSIQQHGPQ
jgi:hypothetical protein